ncbi:beta-1,3-glucan-binding protein [Homalodisca vitripennis]|uniref:beta-1,3-glucan-binding protein n=1 Tax=Homalodisca vitripennis TaxID=197043 RepID=UPI001EEBFB51|nr:beta-1,3-glucan-binding protein [Homalodisca vitripennis]
MLMRVVAVVCLVSCCYGEFTVPEAKLEFINPKGLRISIPDTDPDVTLVAFHVNVNEEFQGVEAGQWAADVLKRRGGRWTYNFPQVKVKKGDTIHYWVYAIRNGLGYQNLDRSYQVTEDNPHGSPGPTTTQKPMPQPPPYPGPTEPPSPLPVDWRNCKLSQTSIRDKAPPCAGRGVFNATFRTIADLSQWQHEIHVGGTHLEDEFTVFTKDSEVISVLNGQLHISPILLEQKYSRNFVTSGTLNLEECTAINLDFCSARAVSYLILPPVISARLTTKKTFSFLYGTVEIKAKLPKGDWIVPEIWLQPKDGAYGIHSGRIVLGLSRGNNQLTVEGRHFGNKLLEAGILLNSSHGTTFQRSQQNSWADDFHIFKLHWTPHALEFSVDDQQIGRIAPETDLDPTLGGEKLAPFDREFYISLGVHVGGMRDFPDTAISGDNQKPWKNTSPKARLRFWETKGQWFPSWTTDSVLLVEYVKVTAL